VLQFIRNITFPVITPLTLVLNNNHWFTITFSNHELPVVSNEVVSARNNTIIATITDIVDAVIETTPPTVVVNRLLNFSLKDILLFSAVISATDSVAALTFIKEEQEPKLFAILLERGLLMMLSVLFYMGYLRNS
jgi:hypothetical protein